MTRTFEDALDTQVVIALDYSTPAVEDIDTVDSCLNNVDYLLDKDHYLGVIDSALCALQLRTLDDPLFLMRDIALLVAKKQHDYGHNNILRHGKVGLRVRMADKVERIRNLKEKGRLDVANESADDSWRDLIGYSLIGLMLDADTFTLPLAKDLR